MKSRSLRFWLASVFTGCILNLNTTAYSQASFQLAAWWPLDGTLADSVSHKLANAVGNPSFITTLNGTGLLLLGTNQYAVAAASSNLDAGATPTGFSINVLLQTYDVSQARPVLEWNSVGGGNYGVHLWLSHNSDLHSSKTVPGAIFANLVDTSGQDHIIQTEGNVIVSNRWAMVTVTYDQTTGNGSIYVNGSMVKNKQLGIFRPQTTSDLYFGHRPVGIDFAGLSFKGVLYDVALYRDPLSTAEVASLYMTVVKAGLGARWTFNGTVDEAVNDTPTVTVGDPTFVPGIIDMGLELSGTNQYAKATASSNLDVGASSLGFAINAWVNAKDISEPRPILEWNPAINGGNYGVHLWLSHNSDLITSKTVPGAIFVNLVDTFGQDHVIQTDANVISSNKFNMLTVTYDRTSGNASIYVNGDMVQTKHLGIFKPQTSTDLYLGHRPTGIDFAGVSFRGVLDEVALYRGPLSAAEVIALYRTVKHVVLGAQWTFDGNVDESINDIPTIAVGHPVFIPSINDLGLMFSGNNPYAMAPASTNMDMGASSTGFSINVWLNAYDLSQARPVLEWNNLMQGGNYGVHMWLSHNSDLTSAWTLPGAIFVNLVDTAGQNHIVQTEGGLISSNKYYMVSLVYSRDTGNASIYINGSLAKTQRVGMFKSQTTYNLYFGYRPAGFNLVGASFLGVLDEVELYDAPLLASEIELKYRAVAGSASIVADWTFEEGNVGSRVTKVEDHSGHGHTITNILGQPTFVQSPPGSQGNISLNLPPGDPAFGSALVSSPSADFNLPDAFTLEAAIRPGDQNGDTPLRYIIGVFDQVTGQSVLGLGFSDFSKINFGPIFAPFPLDGKSHHVAATYANHTVSLYLDGDLMGRTNFIITGFPDPGRSMIATLGANYQGEFWFSGVIDRARIANRALTPSEFFLAAPTESIVITRQPANQTASLGGSVTFSVEAAGTPPLSYQWRFNAANIPNATNAAYTVNNVHSNQYGNYDVVISNVSGTITSALAVLSPPVSTAVVLRHLPAAYTPGLGLTVSLETTPPSGTTAYAVEDQPPAGWTVSGLSNDGVFDALNRKVKFGPFLDANPRTLTYVVTPPVNATGTQSFAGKFSSDGGESPIGGDSQISPAAYHPADNNPADWRITIGEVTAYSAAWKRGDNWPVAPNPIPIGYMTRAAYLWQHGEVYAFNPAIANAPLWWVNVGAGARLNVLPPKAIQHALASANENQAEASMAATFVPGNPLNVTITVTPAQGVSAYAIEDQPPSGWTVTTISNEGSFDTTSRKIKWGPYFDSQARTLSYQVTSPSEASDTVQFTGLVSFDGVDVTIAGQRTARLETGVPIFSLKFNSMTPTGLVLNVSGLPNGRTVQLQRTEDFQTWDDLGFIITNSTGSLIYTDLGITNNNRSFFRAVSQ